MKPDERELIALRYLVGLTSGEIADIRGTTASAIRGRLARLLERIRGELGDG